MRTSLTSLFVVVAGCSTSISGDGGNPAPADASAASDLATPDLASVDAQPPPDRDPWLATACPDLELSALELDFPPSPQVLRIKAAREQPLRVERIAVSGPMASAFHVGDGGDAFDLADWAQRSLTITCTPPQAGGATATLSIWTAACPPVDVTLIDR